MNSTIRTILEDQAIYLKKKIEALKNTIDFQSGYLEADKLALQKAEDEYKALAEFLGESE